MTETKFFEIRDVGTHIPAMAVLMVPEDGDYQLCWAGFGNARRYFLLTNLITLESQYDEFKWRNPRTLGNAHRAIIRDWETLKTGDVIDVEFFLGESTVKKESERFHDIAV